MKSIDNILSKLKQERSNLSLDLPSRKIVEEFVQESINIMFPVRSSLTQNTTNERNLLLHIEHLLKKLLVPIENDIKYSVKEVCNIYIEELPNIVSSLMKDIKAIVTFDPATHEENEVVLSYPGFFAISAYRLAHILYKIKIPLIPRMMTEFAHSKTGIDINPGAEIGESFFIDHGTGIVIGETALIKDNVKIYQGVTLGALQVKKSLAKQKRHPTVESNVIIYSNATILGGKTIIGEGSIIGGNVWLTSSVKPYSLVYHSPKTKIISKKDYRNNIDFQI